jgi:hypothetical protein
LDDEKEKEEKHHEKVMRIINWALMLGLLTGCQPPQGHALAAFFLASCPSPADMFCDFTMEYLLKIDKSIWGSCPPFTLS